MKKIRKTYSGVVPNGKVLNSRNNSQQDTYSSAYLNRAIPDTNDLGEIIVDDVTCKNIFDGVLELGAINNSGVNFGDVDAVRSVNFINVTPNTTYTQSSVDNYKTIVFFYNSSKTFISKIGNNLSTNTFTTPSNCVYVKICTYASEGVTDTNTKFQIEKGKVATNYVEHKEFGYNKSVILFENATGSNKTTITLNDNVDNYDYIEIYAKEMAGRSIYTKLTKLNGFNNRVFPIFAFVLDPSNKNWSVRGCCFTLSGNTMTKDREMFINSTGTTNTDTGNVQLQKVIGIKSTASEA